MGIKGTKYRPFVPFTFETTGETRQRRYMEARVSGLSATKSAELAGYKGRALRTPRKLIESTELKRRFQSALSRQTGGTTMDTLAGTLVGALAAETEGVRLDAATGKLVPALVADHRTRVQAVKAAGELMGMGERASAAGVNVAIQINMPTAFAERYAGTIDPAL